jgi:hypothetical protein
MTKEKDHYEWRGKCETLLWEARSRPEGEKMAGTGMTNWDHI